MRAFVLFLIMAFAAPLSAEPAKKNPPAKCAAGETVQRWYTVHSPNGRAVRVPLNPCDKDGNPTQDKDIYLSFNREDMPAAGECKAYADKVTTVYVREPGETAFKPVQSRSCLQR